MNVYVLFVISEKQTLWVGDEGFVFALHNIPL